jgi:hypothetical protein
MQEFIEAKKEDRVSQTSSSISSYVLDILRYSVVII